MKQKIKKFLSFAGSAWRGSTRGKIGLVLGLFAAMVFVRMFIGDTSVYGFVRNGWRLKAEQKQLAAEQAKLDKLALHIKLIQNHSPDYIEELSQTYLNLGDPKLRILK